MNTVKNGMTRRHVLAATGAGALAAGFGVRPAFALETVRQGYQTNMWGMPTYYLLRSGLLEKHGVKFEEFAVPSGNLTMQQMVARQVDPGAKFTDAPRLKLIGVEGGDQVATIPRSFVTLMERCSHVGLKQTELENRFLFDLSDGTKARDVVRHLTDVMSSLGLLDNDNGTLKQISSHVLDRQVKAAEDWLDARFESAVSAIKAIHHDEGARLLQGGGSGGDRRANP